MRPAAAIDIGTNTVDMVLRDESGALERWTRFPRLGDGVDAAHRLSPAAIDRTVAALAEMRGFIDQGHVEDVDAVATSACRDASNVDEFLDAAEGALGVRPRVISGHDEARLMFEGAVGGLDAAATPGPYVVVDIGGGSTEFAFGTQGVETSYSADIGAVRLTEQFLRSDPVAPEELAACLSVVKLHLDDVDQAIPGLRDGRLVCVSGTSTTAAAVEIGLAAYDFDTLHRFVLTKAAAEDVFRTLASETIDERRSNPGLDEGRVEVIVGGLCILVSVMRHFGFDEALISETNLRDGVLWDTFSTD